MRGTASSPRASSPHGRAGACCKYTVWSCTGHPRGRNIAQVQHVPASFFSMLEETQQGETSSADHVLALFGRKQPRHTTTVDSGRYSRSFKPKAAGDPMKLFVDYSDEPLRSRGREGAFLCTAALPGRGRQQPADARRTWAGRGPTSAAERSVGTGGNGPPGRSAQTAGEARTSAKRGPFSPKP